MQLSDLWDGYSHPWLLATLIAVLAAAVAVVLQGAIYAILRRVTRVSTVASAVVELTALPARYVLPLLALQFVLAAAPEAVGVQPGLESTFAVLLTAAITWFAVRAVAGVAEAVVRLNPANVADNLHARRVQTQTRVLARTVMFFIVLIGAASALMTFPGMRQIGTSLLASAGVAGLVAGIAARPVLGNLIAGLQIALTQPIRLDDVVIMENEWGRIEEITSTYVVVKIWDERRLVVPLQYVIEHPFQNWTRTGSELLGTVYLWLDYRVPIAPLRAELQRVCESAPEWDKRVAMIQVTDADQHAIQIRVLVSTQDASKGWDLRCRVREALIDFVQREYPEALPRLRAEMDRAERHPPSTQPAPPPQRAGKGDSTAIKHPTNPEVNAAHDERAPAEAQSTR